jgi:hypothetical protein
MCLPRVQLYFYPAEVAPILMLDHEIPTATANPSSSRAMLNDTLYFSEDVSSKLMSRRGKELGIPPTSISDKHLLT